VKLLATLADSLDPGFGRIVEGDLDREDANIVLEWLPPPSLRTSGKGSSGIALLGTPGKSDLVVCAHAGLRRIDPATWTVTGVLHRSSCQRSETEGGPADGLRLPDAVPG